MHNEKSGMRLLETSQLLMFITGNAAAGPHYAGYNGLVSLVPKNLGNNIFVPAFSGLNYEITFIKGLEQDEAQMFEPRKSPMRIEYGDDSMVCLHQPSTSFKGIEASITFRIEEPYYIHQNIKLVFHKQIKDRMDFSGLFASYLYRPPNIHAYLKISQPEDDLAGWVGVTKEAHKSFLYTAHELPDRELTVGEHIDLYKKAPILKQYEMINEFQPFYYGLYYDYAFIMMFKDPSRTYFTYSPNGGGTEYSWSSAWDYMIVQDDVKLETAYEWDLCLAFKPYAGRRDILREVERYNSRR